MAYSPQPSTKRRPQINVEQTKWLKGYVSALAESRIPRDGLADMTNMIIEQDGLPRPRPSLAAYGEELLGECIGIGTFTKTVIGTTAVIERWEISMQVISSVGKVHIRKDGGAWTVIVDSDNSYDETAQVNFTQGNNRVYVSNGVNTMSYYDINAGTIVAYTALATPSAPTLAASASLTGTGTTQRYRITFNNNVGETNASVAATVTIGKARDTWDGTNDYVDVSWTLPGGVTSANVYTGTAAGNEQFLTTVNGATFRDDNRTPTNPFKVAPPGNSTGGPILKNMINSNGQLFGVGDKDNPSYLWYSGAGVNAGDFSPFNGGGYVAIDYGGDTVPIAVRAYRTGKGDPAATVLSQGMAGKGRFSHVVFETTTYGDFPITYPRVIEANGQSGTVAANAVVEANNSLYYPTGTDFKSTGTKANIVNILTTDSIAQAIDKDIMGLNLAAMDKCVGLEYQNKVYYAVPYGSDENNQIWILDLSRNGLWVLRWEVAAKFMWLYEDNSGQTHFCVLVDGQIGEFTRSVATQDFGQPFATRVASGGLVWDDTGTSMGAIQNQYFKFLRPVGTINIAVAGIGEDGPISALGSGEYVRTVPPTSWSQFPWSEAEWSNDIGQVLLTSQDIAVVPVEVDDTVNQLTWEITTQEANCDYFLSSVKTEGKLIERYHYGD